MDFLTVNEAARILKAHSNTVYKLCRLGRLPGVKMGKEWRIDRKKLEESLAAGDRDTPLPSPHPGGANFDPCHELVILEEREDVWDFEAHFLRENIRKGYQLLKACWWQTPEQARKILTKKGVPVAEMEKAGEMVIVDLAGIFQEAGPVAAAKVWRSAARGAVERGFKGLIGCGSPTMDGSCHRTDLFTFEEALDGFLDGLPVKGACVYHKGERSSWDWDVLVRLIKLHGQVHFRTKDAGVTAKVVQEA